MADVEKVKSRINTREQILNEAYKQFFIVRRGTYKIEKGMLDSDREFLAAFEYLAGKSLIDTNQDALGFYVTITPYGIDYVESKILDQEN